MAIEQQPEQKQQPQQEQKPDDGDRFSAGGLWRIAKRAAAGAAAGITYGFTKKDGGFGEAMSYAWKGALTGGAVGAVLNDDVSLTGAGAEAAGAGIAGLVGRLTKSEGGFGTFIASAGGAEALSAVLTKTLGGDVGAKVMTALGVTGAAGAGAIGLSKIAGGSSAAPVAGGAAATGAGITGNATIDKGLNSVKSFLTGGPSKPGEPDLLDRAKHALGLDGPDGLLGGIGDFLGEHKTAGLAAGAVTLFSMLRGKTGFFGGIGMMLGLFALFAIGGKLIESLTGGKGLMETIGLGQKKTNDILVQDPTLKGRHLVPRAVALTAYPAGPGYAH